MAVLGRLLVGSGQRLDLADLLSIDSYVASDFKNLVQSFVGGETPYILKGFDVIQPTVQTNSLSIRIADSVVYYPGSLAGSFFYGLPEGNIYAQPLIPELRDNTINFVYATFTTFNTGKDTRAYWDVDLNAGEGGEFSQDVNTESVLTVTIGVSVSTFPENTIPICKVQMQSGNIVNIQDCRDLLFRLGSGGLNPDPFSSFAFRELPDSSYTRDEPPTTMSNNSDPNPFQGGDKNIYTLKEWMDVIMTKLKELSGDPYWYSGVGSTANPVSFKNLFSDTLASTLKSKGRWEHDAVVAGQATWTEDIHQIYLRDKRDIVIRSSTINISNNNTVAWIDLARDADINSINSPVDWINGSATVTGVTGSFEYLSKGDWIKKKSDYPDKYLRIEEFYIGLSATTPALATSIKLSENYAGTTGSAIADFSKGEYISSDINISSRTDSAVQNAGGNFMWLAYRSDTMLGLSSVVPTSLTIDITEADGQRARIATVTPHGLVSKDRITIVGGAYAGSHQVEVVDSTNAFIETTITGDLLAQSAFYGIVTTAARSTADGFNLETANHGFQTNEVVELKNISSQLNGSYSISVRTDTSFQIPLDGSYSSGSVDDDCIVLPRLNVRTEFGTVKVVQGESTNIGDMDSKNILSYIGMDSLAQLKPLYVLPNNYNALQGHQNYNCNSDDDLTSRAAKLTAMMADRIQDRGIQILERVNIQNITNGIYQDINSSSNLTIVKPSSPNQTISLSTPISLPANSMIVADIGRDASTAITPVVVSIGNSLLLQENRIILFYRFATTDVFDWNGSIIKAFGHINTQLPEDSQNRNVTVFNPGIVRLDLLTNQLVLDVQRAANKTNIVTLDGSLITQSSYFLFSSAHDVTNYYVWYNIDGLGIDPALSGKTSVEVSILSTDNAIAVAAATISQINTIAGADATASNLLDVITLVNDVVGKSTLPIDGVVGTSFTFAVIQIGFDPDIEILIPGSQSNSIDVDAINTLGTLIVNDGDSVWVRIDRFASKIFNSVSTSDTSDSVSNGLLFVTTTTSVPIDQDVFVLWSRSGNNILVLNASQDPRANTYDEFLEVVSSVPGTGQILGPVVSGTVILMPRNSRNSNNIQEYIVGSGMLEVFYNGQYLRNGSDWEEVGDLGALSRRIRLLRTIIVNSTIGFRIDANGAVYFAAGSAGGGSLQDAYDGGRFISTIVGQPIVISGPSGKLLSVQGDIEVTGVIDPKGITFSTEATDPLGATDHGLWVNTTGELVYKKVATSLNISTELIRTDGSVKMAANLDLNSHKIINSLAPLDPGDLTNKAYVDSKDRLVGSFIDGNNNTGSTIVAGSVVIFSQSVSGNIELANANNILTCEGVVGVVVSDITDGSSGKIQTSGEIVVLGSPFGIGKNVYVSSSTPGIASANIPVGTGKVVFILGVAKTTASVVLAPHFITVNDNVYDESIVGQHSVNDIITLPNDSRDGSSVQSYVVGTGILEVYYNGQYLRLGSDWAEVGVTGSSSTTIEILRNIPNTTDTLSFRMPLTGKAFFGAGGGGGGGTLQDAYNSGRFIAVSSGNPIYISGTAGQKLISVQGDMEVTGVIDPIGLQLTPVAANPLTAGQKGIWTNLSNELIYEDGVSSNNVSQFINNGGTSAKTVSQFKNGTLSTLSALTPVYVNASGDIAAVDPSFESKSFGSVGIVVSDISSAQFGDIACFGRMLNITTSTSFGDILYVSKTGTLTNVKPSIGVGGFISGDWVIRVGVVCKNIATPTNKDLLVNIVVQGQL